MNPHICPKAQALLLCKGFCLLPGHLPLVFHVCLCHKTKQMARIQLMATIRKLDIFPTHVALFMHWKNIALLAAKAMTIFGLALVDITCQALHFPSPPKSHSRIQDPNSQGHSRCLPHPLLRTFEGHSIGLVIDHNSCGSTPGDVRSQW